MRKGCEVWEDAACITPCSADKRKGSTMRMTLLVPLLGGEQMLDLADKALSFLGDHFTPDFFASTS